MDEKSHSADFPEFPPPYSAPGDPAPAYNQMQAQPPAYQPATQPPTYQPATQPPTYQPTQPPTYQLTQPPSYHPAQPPTYRSGAMCGYPYAVDGRVGVVPVYLPESDADDTYHMPGAAVVIQGYPSHRLTPPDYLSWSLLTLMCLFWPIGIPAVIYSLRVREAVSTGDLARAEKDSATCRKLNIAGMVLGILTLALVMIIVPVVMVTDPFGFYHIPKP